MRTMKAPTAGVFVEGDPGGMGSVSATLTLLAAGEATLGKGIWMLARA